MRPSSIYVSMGLLISALLATPAGSLVPPARAVSEPDQPEAGPSGSTPESIHSEEVAAPQNVPSAPLPLPAGPVNGSRTPQPILSEDGTVLGTFTAPDPDAPAPPLNAIVRAKLEMARAAIAAAEAAGTRAVTLPEHSVPAPADLERIKLERLAALAPQPMAIRPGAPAVFPATQDLEVDPSTDVEPRTQAGEEVDR